MEKEAVKAVMRNGRTAALGIIRQAGKREKIVREIEERPAAKHRITTDYWQTVVMIGGLLQDYRSGRYQRIPLSSVALIAAALLYLLAPIRLLPKWLPFGAFIEKTLVLAAVLELVDQDLTAYRLWKSYEA